MADKRMTQIIYCALRKRKVEVAYTVSGSWFAHEYEVASCPAMHDGGTGCDRRCKTLLSLPGERGLFAYATG